MPNFGARKGRPSYAEFLRHFIPEAVRVLGRARPCDLERYFQETFGRRITDDTMRKYAEKLAEEGVLRREVIVDNALKGEPETAARHWRMIWYLPR